MCGKIIEFVYVILCLSERGVPFLVSFFFQRSGMCLLQKLLPLFATCLEPISKYRIFLCNNLNESTINFCLKFCFWIYSNNPVSLFLWVLDLYFVFQTLESNKLSFAILSWLDLIWSGKVNLTSAARFHFEWAAFSFVFVWRVFKVFRLKICLSRKCVNKCFSVFNKYDV